MLIIYTTVWGSKKLHERTTPQMLLTPESNLPGRVKAKACTVQSARSARRSRSLVALFMNTLHGRRQIPV